MILRCHGPTEGLVLWVRRKTPGLARLALGMGATLVVLGPMASVGCTSDVRDDVVADCAKARVGDACELKDGGVGRCAAAAVPVCEPEK